MRRSAGIASMLLEDTAMNTQQRLAEKYAMHAEEVGKGRPLHHSPLFWGGVILFVFAISVYMFPELLAWLPLWRH
ncbi:MAG TPA: hypothetical protein VKP60_11710 [Magnetospirillaceae bacterium]|nr:hypothetical protein [Magnetospirillaceae bacterium]